MISEISKTELYPFSAIALIESTFSSGTRTIGTGTLVGRNDVLTACHVVFNPNLGGYATSIRITLGADYNSVTQRLENAPFGSLQARVTKAWPEMAFVDADNRAMNFTELPWDVALLGLSTSIGLDVGWFGMEPDANFNQEAFELGYSDTSAGLMFSRSMANSSNGMSISTFFNQGSPMLGPGSSGGPLYLAGGITPSIIGLKSGGNSVVNYWADIGFLYDQIRTAMNDNNVLIGGVSIVDGDAVSNYIQAKLVSEQIDGKAGIYTVIYGGNYSDYKITVTGNIEFNVISKSNVADADTLTNIERLKFTDKNIALDLAPSQSAGKTALLLGAVLPGQLVYDVSKQALVGAVVNLFDQNYTLAELSGALLRLPIWDVLTGKAAPTKADIAGYLVNNVYGGTQTAAITNAAIAAMNAETPSSQGAYLASLAASAANQTHVDLVGVQTTGLEYLG